MPESLTDKELAFLCQQIISHLPGEWQMEANYRVVHFEDENSRFSFYIGTCAHNRLEVRYSPPSARNNDVYSAGYGKQFPSITVSAKRTPADIAKDIEHRFMPEATEVHAKAMQWVYESDHAQDEQESSKARLLGATRGKLHPNRPDSVCGKNWTARVGFGGSICLDLGYSSIPFEKVVRIAAILDEEAAQ